LSAKWLKKVAGYPGDGNNRWPAADTRDVGRLYRLALESAPAGSRLHAVAEEGIALRDTAAAIGRRLGVPVAPVTAENAERHFGYLSAFVGLDNPTSSRITRDMLGWTPAGPASSQTSTRSTPSRSKPTKHRPGSAHLSDSSRPWPAPARAGRCAPRHIPVAAGSRQVVASARHKRHRVSGTGTLTPCAVRRRKRRRSARVQATVVSR
jgi:hypothetical protein